MTQTKLFDYKEDDTPEWIIEQLKGLGMTYTEMANRMGVNRSTLYRFRKGTHRTPEMKEKILKMYKNPYHGVAIFDCEGHGSPFFKGKVYRVVYNEADFQRQLTFKRPEGCTVIYSKFVKRFTSSMVEKHYNKGVDLENIYGITFRDLDNWVVEQIQLMKTQKTKHKTLKLLPIDYKV
jgi:transcriptional regulator with XRE-family HTH domain